MKLYSHNVCVEMYMKYDRQNDFRRKNNSAAAAAALEMQKDQVLREYFFQPEEPNDETFFL